MKNTIFVSVIMLLTQSSFSQNLQQQGPSVVCCDKNLLQNGQLIGNCSYSPIGDINNACLPSWQPHSATPQHYYSMGYSTQGFVSMWGYGTPNESIKQNVNFVSGTRYRISCAVRKTKPDPQRPENDGARVRFYIGNTTSPHIAETFELKYSVLSDQWIFVSLPEFTYTGTTGSQPFIVGVVSADASKFAFAQIDDLCLQELPPCDRLIASTINGPNPLCEGSAASYSVPNFPGATYMWSVSPTVSFTGNNTSTINIPASATIGKTQLTISVKGKCGNQEFTKTLTVKILKRISDAEFGLTATQSTAGYSATATPSAGSAYTHYWVLYESATPFSNCSFPLPAGATTKVVLTTHLFSLSGLTPGRHYMLRHMVQNCDGNWLTKNKCFSVATNARLRANNEYPLELTEGVLQTIKSEEIEVELLEVELRRGQQ